MSNIETLLEDLMKLRSNENGIWNKAKELALNPKMEIIFCHGHRQRMHDGTSTTKANMAEMNDTDNYTEDTYFIKMCFALIDNVVTGLTVHFNAAKKLVVKTIFGGNITVCEVS